MIEGVQKNIEVGETEPLASRRHAPRLDAAAGLPLYHQLATILRGRIYAREIAVGGLMPSEQELCAEYGVSRITAARALNELAAAGLVVRERGRGTRVVSRPPPAVVTSSVEGWLETASLMGITTEARVLSFDYVAAEPSVAEALDLPADARVQRAVRVRLLEGAPFSYLVTYVPEPIGSQYDAADLGSHPLLHLLERAGVRVASARQSITAIGADAEIARALSIQIGAPLLEVQRVVRDSDERPVEFIRVLYRPELYSFEMSMKRIRRAEGTQWVNTENTQ